MAIAATAILVSVPTTAVAAPTSRTAAPARNEIGIRLLDAPESERADPRALMYIIDQLRPGVTIVRHLGVSNSTVSARSVSLYAAAAVISGGRFRFAEGRRGNGLSSWTTVSPARIVVAAGKEAHATVRIRVPPDATGGERYAVLWAQVSSRPAPGKAVEVSRVGVRVYLAVDAAGPLSTRFEITGLTGQRVAGVPLLRVTVHNTGQRAVDLDGTAALRDGPGGSSVAKVRLASIVTLGPGQRGTGLFHWPASLASGPWTADVTLTSGTVSRTAQARVTFAGGPTGASESSGVLPWWAFVVGALAVLIVLLLVLRRRSRRQDRSRHAAA